jgi:hypothetical protein
MKNFPVFHSHDAVECFHCERSIPATDTSESNYANGSGGFKAYCPDCDLTTFYDLSAALPARRPRGRGLAAAAAILAMLLTGCAHAPNPQNAAPAPSAAERHRVVVENALILQLAGCQPRPLNRAQAHYLATQTERTAQRYLVDLADPICAWKWIRACETRFPGECIAVPGEQDGRRP